MEEAALAERNDNKTLDAKEEKAVQAENVQFAGTAALEEPEEQASVHTHVDIRL